MASVIRGSDNFDSLLASSFLADSGKSFSTNGYQKLSNGLIIQWGYNNTSGTGNTSQTFPIAFPNACLNVTIGGRRAGGGASYNVILVGDASTAGFTFYMYYYADNMRYIAIGY